MAKKPKTMKVRVAVMIDDHGRADAVYIDPQDGVDIAFDRLLDGQWTMGPSPRYIFEATLPIPVVETKVIEPKVIPVPEKAKKSAKKKDKK